MYPGQNPWGMYPPTPQYMYIPPYPPAPPGVQPINTSDEAFKLAKKMRKDERRQKKEWADETNKKKEGDKKPDDKKRIDTYFATKAEVIFFMLLIAIPVGVCEALLVRILLAKLV